MLCPWALARARWGEAVHIPPLVVSSCRSVLPSLLGSPHEHCKVAEDFDSHGVSIAANRAGPPSVPASPQAYV